MELRQVGTVLIQTGYSPMCSLKGHHLLVHQHSKTLLNTHPIFKYEEKLHLFQTTDCTLSTTMPYHATAQKFCKIKTHLAAVSQGDINFGNKNDTITFLSNWSQ